MSSLIDSPQQVTSPAKRHAPPVDASEIEGAKDPKSPEVAVKIEPEDSAGPSRNVSGSSGSSSYNNNDNDTAPLLEEDNDLEESFVVIDSADAPRIKEVFIPYPDLANEPTPTVMFNAKIAWPPQSLLKYCEREPLEPEKSMSDLQLDALETALNQGAHRKSLQLNEVNENGVKTGKVVSIDLMKELEKPGPVAAAILSKLLPQQRKTPAQEDPVYQAYEENVPEPICLIPFLSHHPMYYVMMLGGVQGFNDTVSQLENMLDQISPDPVVDAVNNMPIAVENRVMEIDADLRRKYAAKRWYKPLTWFNTPDQNVWDVLGLRRYQQTCNYWFLERFLPKYCHFLVLPVLWGLFLAMLICIWVHFCSAVLPYHDDKDRCNSRENMAATFIATMIFFGFVTMFIVAAFQKSKPLRVATRLTHRIRESILFNEMRRMAPEWRRFADWCDANPQAARYLPPYCGVQPATAGQLLEEILANRFTRNQRQIILQDIERDEAMNYPAAYDPIVNPNDPNAELFRSVPIQIPNPSTFIGNMVMMDQRITQLHKDRMGLEEAERLAAIPDPAIAAGVAVPGYGITLPRVTLREPRATASPAPTSPAPTPEAVQVATSTTQTTAAVPSQAAASTSQAFQATSTTAEAEAAPAQVAGVSAGVSSSDATLDLSVSDANASHISQKSAATVSSSDDSTVSADTTADGTVDTTGELDDSRVSRPSRSSQSSNEN